MKRVMITGAAGFIGAHTLEHLLENTDWEIIAVDSLLHHGKKERIIQVIKKNKAWAARTHFYRINLAAPEAQLGLISIIPDVDYIINLAAESHVDRSITDPVPFIKNNVNLMLNMLEYARLTKPKVFMQISTDEVYGPMLDSEPFREWDRELPSNPYSASKAAQEMIAISYWRTYGVPLVITNTMNNIGEMQDAEKFVPLVIKKVLTGEEISIHGNKADMGSRFYLHARNHADALLFILRQVKKPPLYPRQNVPARFHIVGDTRVGNLDMAERIAALVGKPLKYKFDSSVRPGHDLHYGLNGSVLKKLGWVPPLMFEDSLERTVQNYLDHPEWLK